MSSDYQNNAYIAALPPALSRPDWMERLDSRPDWNESERSLPHQDRYACALRLLRFFNAGQRQVDFARGFDAVLREGYRGRDDGTQAHEVRMLAIATAREAGELKVPGRPVVIRNASSSALIGMPGMGKTATLNRILSRYPQVVRHPDGQEQIVWVKLECPAMGSIRQTCRDFLKMVDSLLGQTTYQKLWFGKHVSDDDLMDAMVTVANIHSIGCLVIDEIQHLGKTGDEQHVLMTFLTTLINKIGVPVLFVGTMSAFERFSKTGRMGRRAISPASAVWPQFAAHNDQWRTFVSELWEYQWTAEYTPPTPELFDALHRRSQGVVDVVTKLWFAVQAAAIDENESTEGEVPERITVELIDEVADEHLKPMEGLLKAIRENDAAAIAKYEDASIRDVASWSSYRDRDGPVLDRKVEADGAEPAEKGWAHIGQHCTSVRDNLEWRGLDAAATEEVMRRTTAALAPPDARNLGQYFAKIDEVIAEIAAENEAARQGRKRDAAPHDPKPTQNGDGLAAAA